MWTEYAILFTLTKDYKRASFNSASCADVGKPTPAKLTVGGKLGGP